MGLFNRKNKFKDLTGQESPPIDAGVIKDLQQQYQQQQQSIPSVPSSLKDPNEECRKLLLQLIKHNDEVANNLLETNQYILGKLESL